MNLKDLNTWRTNSDVNFFISGENRFFPNSPSVRLPVGDAGVMINLTDYHQDDISSEL